jgi:DNA (cytosine-5)-methyltransferase 1
MAENHPNGSYFNEIKLHPNEVVPTIRANGLPYDYETERTLYNSELYSAGSYPKDYNFVSLKPDYLIGMSVPPVMTANIATEIYNQWVSKLQ